MAGGLRAGVCSWTMGSMDETAATVAVGGDYYRSVEIKLGGCSTTTTTCSLMIDLISR
jgi:hypothetical protein